MGWEQYNRRLEQYNILVKARNFLVFQVGAALKQSILGSSSADGACKNERLGSNQLC